MIKFCGSRLSNYCFGVSLVKKSRRCLLAREYSWKKRRTSEKAELLRTEMLIQNDSSIYELPIVINKVHDLGDTKSTKSSPADLDELSCAHLNLLKNLGVKKLFRSTRDSALSRINSPGESLIHAEINSRVALQSLRQVVNSERKQYKSKGSLMKFSHERQGCVSQLIDAIAASKDGQIIVEALSILLRDKFNPLNNPHKDALSNEALLRATKGELSVQQLIDCCKILFAFRDFRCHESIDYFWIGFVNKEADINSEHLVSMFRLLKHFRKSKLRLRVLLENKFLENYQSLSVHQLTELVNVFQNLTLSPAVVDCVGRWTGRHLASVSRYDLLEFVEGLSSAKYVSPEIERALENVVSAKPLKSQDHALVTALAVYCSTTRLRNVSLLNKIAKYFERHSKSVPLNSAATIVEAFGKLNFRSKGPFWTSFESALDHKYGNLQPEEMLRVLVSCAYVDKYFPRLTTCLYSAEFLKRIDQETSRSQLYVLDAAMTVECDLYNGPFLFNPGEDPPAPVDEKITRAISEIDEELLKLAGHGDRLTKNVTVNLFPRTPLYTLDALIHEEPLEDSLEMKVNSGKKTAVLVLLPEFYCWNSNKLIGPQAMKIRHLRKLGFKLMLLNFKTLTGLRNNELEKYLRQQFEAARVIKTAKEIEVLRYVAKVSCTAHMEVMRKVKHGFAEFQAEATFLHHVYTVGGCRHASYQCICCSGKNGAILHYGHAGYPNAKILSDGEMCLFDMGGNYCGYAADITCSYPVNGKFSEDQKLIYNAVLRARDAVMSAAKPGVSWTDMHLLASREMLDDLKNKAGLLKGEVEDMIRAGIHAVFQPHGLGHFLGLDVHDVGGYLADCPPRSDKPGLNKLRTARVLKAGMVLTIEPGCYFIDWVLKKASKNPEQSKFINWDVASRFTKFGGVRIEDDVLITETGTENLSSYLPRTVEEIEAFMANGEERKDLPQDCVKGILELYQKISSK